MPLILDRDGVVSQTTANDGYNDELCATETDGLTIVTDQSDTPSE